MNETELDRLLAHALDVAPSPDFTARVRTRIANLPRRRAPLGLAWWAVGATGALAAVAVALVALLPGRPSPASEPGALAASQLELPLTTAVAAPAGSSLQAPTTAAEPEGRETARAARAPKVLVSPAPVVSPTSIIPLKFDVIVVRHKDDKVVSRTPYTLSVNTNAGKSSVRMGIQIPVPVPGNAARTPDGQPVAQGFQYRDVGTNIDCFARTFGGNQFQVGVTIEDSSVYAATDDTTVSVPGAPMLRSFRATNELTLRDGQSTEFMAATDNISGEVIKVEVKVTVVK